MKQKSKTLTKLRQLKWAERGLIAGKFASPLIPASVMTAINWDDWFAKAGTNLPFGLSALLVTTLLAVVGIWKKDELVNKKVSAVFYLALLFVCLGFTNIMLASLFTQVGWTFVATAGGLLASATCDEVDKLALKDNIAYYEQLVKDNALDPRERKKQERRALARQEALREAEEMQATE